MMFPPLPHPLRSHQLLIYTPISPPRSSLILHSHQLTFWSLFKFASPSTLHTPAYILDTYNPLTIVWGQAPCCLARLSSVDQLSNSLGLQQTRPPCPSATPGTYSNSVHCVGDAIQPSHPLLSPSPPTFNLSQHQGLFQ